MIPPNQGTVPPHVGTIQRGPYVRPDSRFEVGPAHVLCAQCGSHRTYYIDDDLKGLLFGCHACDHWWA